MTLDIAQRLRVKRQVKTLWEVLKEGGFINFYCFSLFNEKTWTIKAFLEVRLASLTLKSEHYFSKIYEKSRKFCCTSLLCSSKLIHLGRNILACLTWNLVQDLMNLVLIAKSNQKMAKTKIVWKSPYSLLFS